MNDRDLLLADAGERERAARDWGGTYLVEAAAGTGKTTLLVSRIVTIITETLTPLSKVAAITFTEKAAGELKVRLRKTLEENAQKTDESGERCRTALRDLDMMPVNTIHAFCRELLQQRPVEAGLDPNFTVLDEAAAGMLREEIWQSWLAAEFAHDAAVRPLLERGMGITSRNRESSLRALFDILIAAREDLDDLHIPARTEQEVRSDLAAFRRNIEQAVLLKNGCRDSSDTLLNSLRDVERWTTGFSGAEIEQAMAWLSERPKMSKNRDGRKGNWDAESLQAAREFFIGSFNERAAELERAMFSVLAAPVLTWLKNGVRAYEQAKEARGVLDFHDLLLRARNMLLQHCDVREFFKIRYDYLLVDEFQDTDPLQTEIVFYLAERANRSAARWDDVELENGKLFLVGDPKQSIYRFRRADLDLYGRVKQRIDECGDCLPIRVNFRSRPELISEINALFEPWMTGAAGERYEPDYVAMEPYRDTDEKKPAVLFLPPPRGFDLSKNSQELAEAEASCIAEFIRERTRNSAAGDHALRFRDIGVLYAAATHLLPLEDALKMRGIPYRTAGGRNLPLRSEMIALRAVLNAIDNPYNETNVVGALRSPFFGCSDDDLLLHRLDGGSFDYVSNEPSVAALAESFGVLRDLYSKRRNGTPAETLAALYSRTAGLPVFALKTQGEMRVANLLNVLETARAFERSGSVSFHRLTRWLDRMEEFRAGEEDYPGDDDDDAVQLMTFHKAKGLEFPAVILYRIAQGPERLTAGVLHDRARKVVEFKSGSWETTGFKRVKEDEQDRQDYESRRLFYVACTRARDLLVIPAYWQSEELKREPSRFRTILDARCASGDDNVPRSEGTGFRLCPTEHYVLETEPQEGLLLDCAVRGDERAIQGARRDRIAWDQMRADAAVRMDHSREFTKPSEHRGGTAETFSADAKHAPALAASFGLYVHRLLQHVDLPHGGNLAKLAAMSVQESGLSGAECDEGVRLVNTALRSSLFCERIANSEKIFRELQFTAEAEGKLIEGVIDLLFFANGSPVIVDFKTDRVASEQVRARAENYRRQAAAYLRAMEAVLHMPVQEVVLSFLRPDATVEFSRDDLMAIAF